MTRRSFVLSSAAFVLFARPRAAHSDEQNNAREALRSGEVVSLGRILARVRAAYAGRVLEAELERGRGGGTAPWIYHVKLLTPQGNVIKLMLNAKTAIILAVKGRGAEAAKKPQ